MIKDYQEQDEIRDENLVSYLMAAPMKNDIGEHNSFINVIIHSLHYIPGISKYMIETDFSIEEQFNLLIEIQRLLDKYEKLTSSLYCPRIKPHFRNLNILPLRSELEYMFSKEKLFKLQTIGEPVDIYYVLLNAIHSYCNNKPNLKDVDDNDCTTECVVHSNLMVYLVEQLECPKCLKKSDLQKFPSNTFYYELKANYIIKKTDRMHYMNTFRGKLFQFSKEEVGETEEECPQHECREHHCMLKRNVILVKASEYICFNLIWPDPNPKLTDVCKVYFSIPEIFSNEEIFNIYDDAFKKRYELYGIICYSNSQYISFFISQLKSEVNKYWILHNDMEVIKLPVWKDVMTYCIMNSYHPVMLYYREITDKTDLSIRCDLEEGDFFQMLNHSLKVDLENATTYANDYNAKNKMRPNTNLTKSHDANLLQSLNNMKKELIPRRNKRLSLEDPDIVNYTEGMKRYTSSRETENSIVSKDVEEVHQEKYQKIDLQTLQSEAFRYQPYYREGDWYCKSENCNNLNNKHTFQCLKCKVINMRKFQELENEKENRLKTKGEMYSTYNPTLSNQNQSQHQMQRAKNIKFNYTYQPTLTHPKICINCNNPFKTKCSYCLMSKSLPRSFQTLQEDSNNNAVSNSAIKIKHNSYTDFLTISKTEQAGWACFHCSAYNIVGLDYCKECKKNKLVR